MRIAAAESFMLGRYPLPESLRRLREAGFTAVEILVPHRIAAGADEAEVSALRRQINHHSLELVALSGGWPLAAPDSECRMHAVATLQAVVELAARLGCPTVTSEINGGTSIREAESVTAFRQSIEDLIPVLDREGITLAVEPHPGDVVEEHSVGLGLVRDFSHPSVGYLFCTPHTFVLGDDAAAMIRDAGDSLAYVHIADTNRQSRIVVGYRAKGYPNALVTDEFRDTMTAHEHLMLGRGDVDFRALASALHDVGYHGILSAVPFEIDSPSDLRQTLNSMEALTSEHASTRH